MGHSVTVIERTGPSPGQAAKVATNNDEAVYSELNAGTLPAPSTHNRRARSARTSRRPALPRHSDRLDGDRDAAPEEHSDSEEPDTGNRWGEAGGVAPGDSMLRRAATHTSSTSIRPFGTSVPSLKSEVRYEWAMPA